MLFVVLCIVCTVGCDGSANNASAPKPYDSQDGLAEVDAQHFGEEAVRKALDFPRDADFGRTDAKRVGEGQWTAFGQVKAMNAFGAMITYDWQANVVLEDEETRNWRLARLVMNDKVVFESDKPFERLVNLPPSEQPPTPEAARADLQAQLAGQVKSETAEEPELRSWSTTDGKFSTDAEFLYAVGDKVKLRKADGAEITVPMAQLSESDRRWIQDRAKQKGK